MCERHLTLPQSSVGIKLQRCSYTVHAPGIQVTNPRGTKIPARSEVGLTRALFQKDHVCNNFCLFLTESCMEPLCIHPLSAAVRAVLIILYVPLIRPNDVSQSTNAPF